MKSLLQRCDFFLWMESFFLKLFLLARPRIERTNHLSVIVRKNRAIAKDRGLPFTFMFSQYESYLNNHGIWRSSRSIFFEISLFRDFGTSGDLKKHKFWLTLGEVKTYLVKLPIVLVFFP